MALEAYKLGYSISSSPVRPLIRVMIDISLKLKNLFQEGQESWEHRRTPALKFFDGFSAPWIPDELGNPLQSKRRFPQKFAYDPKLSDFFGKLAQSLVQIQLSEQAPKDLYSFGEPQKVQKKIKHESYHFFRRTRDKRR